MLRRHAAAMAANALSFAHGLVLMTVLAALYRTGAGPIIRTRVHLHVRRRPVP